MTEGRARETALPFCLKTWNMLTAETSGLHRLAHFYVSSRYCILFYMLLFTMVAAPLCNTLNLSGTLIESLLAASLLTAIMPVDTARSRHALLVLMIVGWLVRIFSESPEHRTFSVMMLVIWTLIGLIAAAAALRFAMRAVKVDSEHLYAALSAYLLGGIYFGLLYWVLEYTKAGTFSSAGEFSQSSAIYFSFVTLATLGYGDITPRADFARAFAIIEGIGGQLFLAVLVARLVSLYSKPGDRSS